MKNLLHTMNGQSPLLARATVQGHADEDQLGRVKVTYPWLHRDSADTPSEWARLCVPYASNDAGSWMIPEVGDEVLVYFENGNMDYPIILGSLYNASRKPPKAGRGADGTPEVRFIKTKSGHLLCFDDSSGEAAILLKDKDGRGLEIKTHEKKIEISDPDGNQIEMGDGKVKIESKGGSTVTLEAGKATVKADKVTIDGSAGIELTANAMHALVKGDLFQSLFNSHVHPTGVGPSGPPMVPMTPTMLSQKVKTG